MPRVIASPLKTWLPELGSYLVIGSIVVLSILFYLDEPRPLLWIVMGLLALLLALWAVGSMRNSWQGRRWLRHVFTIAQAGVILLLMLIPPRYGFYPILFFVLSAEVPMLFPQRIWQAYIVIFASITTAVALFTSANPDTALATSLIYGGGYYFFASFANITAHAQAAQAETEKLLQELQIANQRLQDYASRVEELAVAEERNRLAREMHDTLGHRLTVVAVQLEGAQRLYDRDAERAIAIMTTAREQVNEALGELRRTVATLRSPVEADLSLPTVIRRLATSFQEATGIAVHLNLADTVTELPDAELPDAHRLALYRAVQEGLTNVQRHAQARQVWVQLARQNGSVTLTMGDDGAGLPADAIANGFGLRGMEERAAQLGGSFDLSTRPGGGAQISLNLPIPSDPTHE